MSQNKESHSNHEIYRQVLYKTKKSCTFDLHSLSWVIVKRQDEVKKVALTKIWWRLLLEVRSGQTATTGMKKFRENNLSNLP